MGMKTTPLHDSHLNLKAHMAPFAGWDMPIHYGSILQEARHTRSAVSIFDVSHMGECIIHEDPDASSLDRIITIPVTKIKLKRSRYGFLLNERGGILDDLIAFRKAGDDWMLVVNAGTQDNDFKIIKGQLSPEASMEIISHRTVKIDIQGPLSLEVMKRFIGDDLKELPYFGFDSFGLMGGECIISRTGYTGELGFEIFIESGKGVELWHELIKNPMVKPAGLGARDILRTEMGYPLYGNELTEETTPLDCGMDRFLDMDKDFTGKGSLLEAQKRGAGKRLAGFVSGDRRTPRHGNSVLVDNREAGSVTSGVFSPHLNRGIGMGHIDAGAYEPEKETFIDAGREKIPAKIVQLPFIKNTSIHYREA
jgi:aminomethyltransferase